MVSVSRARAGSRRRRTPYPTEGDTSLQSSCLTTWELRSAQATSRFTQDSQAGTHVPSSKQKGQCPRDSLGVTQTCRPAWAMPLVAVGPHFLQWKLTVLSSQEREWAAGPPHCPARPCLSFSPLPGPDTSAVVTPPSLSRPLQGQPPTGPSRARLGPWPRSRGCSGSLPSRPSLPHRAREPGQTAGIPSPLKASSSPGAGGKGTVLTPSPSSATQQLRSSSLRLALLACSRTRSWGAEPRVGHGTVTPAAATMNVLPGITGEPA